MSNLPEPHVLRQLLAYNPLTGTITWKERGLSYFASSCPAQKSIMMKAWNKRHAGKEAFCTNDTGGYLTGAIFRTRVAAHRVAFALIYNRWPDGQVDHINGDRTDNRASNLREVSNAENGQNCKRRKDNTTGATGVRTSGRKFSAYICHNGRRLHLGTYPTFNEALTVRKSAEREFGFHENHGR